MALKEQKILLRSGDLLEWEIADPILMKGEVAFIDDIYKLKIGNGEDPFSELPILNDDGLLQQAVYQLQIDKADRTELFSGSYIDLADVPSDFNPSDHIHTISDVTDLQSSLDSKVDKVVGKQLSTEDFTTDEKNKLNGIETGAQVNVATNLAYTPSTRVLTSSTGNNVTLPQVTTSDDGLMTASDKSKLNGIANNATANSTDAQLRDRTTHTGEQPISTVTGLQNALDDKEPTFTKNTAFNKNFGATSGTVCEGDDSRLTNSREWTASTISQAEAENGTATTRRAFTAQRVRQAIVSWWNSLDIIGKGDDQVPTNQDIREKYDVQSLISVEPTLSLDFSKNVYSVYEP